MVPCTYTVGGYSFDQICYLSIHIPTTRDECRKMIERIDFIEKAFSEMVPDRVKDSFEYVVRSAIAQRDNFLRYEY